MLSSTAKVIQQVSLCSFRVRHPILYTEGVRMFHLVALLDTGVVANGFLSTNNSG